MMVRETEELRLMARADPDGLPFMPGDLMMWMYDEPDRVTATAIHVISLGDRVKTCNIVENVTQCVRNCFSSTLVKSVREYLDHVDSVDARHQGWSSTLIIFIRGERESETLLG
jgi:hypothetical protein